jgi:hypothetical protein
MISESVHFDLTTDGATAGGSVSGLETDVRNVHMVKE